MKIKLPAHFTDITLREYHAWHEGKGDARLNIFIDQVGKMKLTAIQSAYAHMEQLMSNEVPLMRYKIEIDGVKYGIINKWDDLTGDEYTDLDVYSRQNRPDKVMSILYRPIVREMGNTYEIEEYNGTKDSEKFWDIPASFYLGAMLFFCKNRTDLLRTSEQSLMEVVRAMLSTSDGVGTSSTSRSRGRIFSRWIKFQLFRFGNCSRIWRTLWTKKEKKAYRFRK